MACQNSPSQSKPISGNLLEEIQDEFTASIYACIVYVGDDRFSLFGVRMIENH